MTITNDQANSIMVLPHDSGIPELPDAFKQRDSDNFYVIRDVSSQEIIEAATSIVKHQLEEYPILMNSTKFAKTLALFELSNLSSEVFCVMFLTNEMRLIYFDRMFKGTVNATRIYLREIVKRALELNAVWLILAHNHPGADCKPSQVDEQSTQQLQSVLTTLNMGIVDHLIVGGGEVFSFAENGKL